MIRSLARHWPEYSMEAAGLGVFMISACFFAAVLEYPGSPVHEALSSVPRRPFMGVAMGLAAIAIIYSPWGKRSGAHINPALTLTFYRLGKIERWDAAFYVLAQFTGGALGVVMAATLFQEVIAHPNVNYVVTAPGPAGVAIAFGFELFMAFVLMTMVLYVTNAPRLARLTGVFAGILVATFITFEAPISGMSINPARTFASAFPSGMWTSFWLYLTAPLAGMLLAAEAYRRLAPAPRCAKLHHDNDKRCIFRCGYAASETPNRGEVPAGAVTAS